MSIALGPQGYASPPHPEPIPQAPAVQLLTVPPEPQPALEVTANEAHDASGGEVTDQDKDKRFDPHGPRRGRLIDLHG